MLIKNPPALSEERPPSDQIDEAFQQLQQAERLRARGELDRARTICEPLVNRYPEYYGALHTLGLIYADKGQFPQALGCLVRACMLDPRSWKSLIALSAVYLELGASEMAARTLEQAKELNEDDPSIHLTLAEIYRSEREYELARDAFLRALEKDRELTGAAIGLANCYLDLGRQTEARDIVVRLIGRGVKTLPVLGLINHLPAGAVSLNVLSEVDKAVPDPGDDKKDFANSAAFIRANALHRLGRYDDAWKEMIRANAELWPHAQGSARELNENQQANFDVVQSRRIKFPRAKAGESSCISLFILGPSRSGKSTMESLLGALPGVKRGYENPALQNAVRRTFQSAGLLTQKVFETLPPRLDEECRAFYFEELANRAGDARVFTTTHPGRIHDVARIAASIPNSRFIFIKRNIDDNLLRIFMQKYAIGNADSYDLKAAHGSLLWYYKMIDMLADKLPRISRVVHYERLVADPTGAVREAAEWLGVSMEQVQLPEIGDDRGCAEPYRDLMGAALRS